MENCSKAALTRQTSVDQLVLAHSHRFVWTTQQHVGKLLTRIETSFIYRQQFTNMLLCRAHTNLSLPTRGCQHKFEMWRPLKVPNVHQMLAVSGFPLLLKLTYRCEFKWVCMRKQNNKCYTNVEVEQRPGVFPVSRKFTSVWKNSLAKRSHKNLQWLATSFGHDLPVVMTACNNIRLIWSGSNLHASQRKFFTVWPPNARSRELILVWFSLVRVHAQGCSEMAFLQLVSNVHLLTSPFSYSSPFCLDGSHFRSRLATLTCDSVWLGL